MLRAPEAPAPTAMHSSAINADDRMDLAMARATMPTSAVKMTSDITRGFRSAKK